jgi:L-ascorbate metabolism protein UlaG (beta-lactamase superfamily)
MKVGYYGHSCFSVVAGGKTLLFDPFITPNPLAKAVDAKKIAADYILVSHGHEDHLADAVKIAKRTGATVIANFEVAVWLNQKRAQNPSDEPRRRFQFRFWPREIRERDSFQHHARRLTRRKPRRLRR